MLDVLIGTVYTRLRESAGPLDEEWVRSVVRLVLAVTPLVVVFFGHTVQLLSNRRRASAHAFYESLGFEPSAHGFRRYLR